MAFLFILRNWKLLLGGLALAGMGFALMLAKGDARHWHKRADQTQAAFDQTVAQYRFAAEAAAKLDAQNVVRVKAEQSAITERIDRDYQTSIATAADRYERLRAKTAGYLGRPSPEGMPDVRETTCLTIAGTSCSGLPSLLKAAQDNTDQLIALQAWTREQAAVDVGGE